MSEKLVAAAMWVMLAALSARAEPLTVFKDAQGRTQGYGTTRGNTTIFENNRGQDVGRVERRPDGALQFYNERGERTGTARTGRK
jgi:hypothetical protein